MNSTAPGGVRGTDTRLTWGDDIQALARNTIKGAADVDEALERWLFRVTCNQVPCLRRDVFCVVVFPHCMWLFGILCTVGRVGQNASHKPRPTYVWHHA